MTASTILGKVAMIPKGIWNDQTSYTKLNVVTIGGSSYLAVQDVPAGTSVTNTTYWQLIAERGSTGGISQLADAFSAVNNYAVGDYCSYNDDIYRFVNAHYGAWDANDVVLTTVAQELEQKITENQLDAILATGTILQATQLETSREILTNLGSETPAEFDGSADITPGVTGVLPVANGGTGNTNGTADSLTTAREVQVNLASSDPASFDGSANIAPGVTGILPKACGGTGNANGTADKLTTARTIRTNLASTSTASFDGSENITPGVTGILPVANGGTGNNKGTVAKLTTARTIRTNLASTSTASFDGSENITPGVSGVLPVANGGTGYGDSTAQTISNTGVFNGNIQYRRVGNLLHIYNTSAITLRSPLSSANLTLCTLPQAYRISSRIVRSNLVVNNDNVGVATYNGANGNISIYKGSLSSIATSASIYINIIAEVS